MNLHMQHPKMIDRSATGMIACSPLRHEMQLAHKALACIPADHVTWKAAFWKDAQPTPQLHTTTSHALKLMILWYN